MNKSIKLINDSINFEDLQALSQWITFSPQLTKGGLTPQLETRFAEFIGTKYSVFVNSGSSAILLGLVALKESGLFINNNKIIIPALSWATNLSIPDILGFKPYLCDTNLEDLSVDLSHLEHLFQTKQPSVFILVSVLGLIPKMNEILELCNRYGVILLEDCCESLGSQFNLLDGNNFVGNNFIGHKMLGTFGRMSFFSTYYGHHISTVEGGFVCTDEQWLYELLLMIRSHGWSRDLSIERRKELREENNIDEFDELYTFYKPGLNVRNTDIGAFLGLKQLDKLSLFCVKRNENFKKFKKLITNNILTLEDKGHFVSCFAFPVLFKNREERNKKVKKLREKNIETRPLIAGNMAKQPWFIKKFGEVNLKNAEKIHQSGLYLPVHPGLTNKDIFNIAEVISE